MIESGYAKGGQSQGVVDGGKLAEGRRWGNWSRRHCFFSILVVAVVLFFYSTDIKELAPEWTPKWWIQYDTQKWWIPFKSQSQNSDWTSTADFNSNTPENSPTVFSQTENSTSTNVTDMNTIHLPENSSVTSQPMMQKTSASLTPVPYVSPGPYLVEYPYEYKFIINEPQKCEEEKPYLVLIVPVAPANRAHRDVIRNTWGGESLVLGKVVKLFFLLGLQTGEGSEQLQLLQESTEHRDLIQSDFLDCYKNLTIKTMMMLEWLDTYCSGASYAMKIDSDMFLNVPNLINMLSHAPKENYMSGLVARGAAVLRDRTSKWYLPVELYPKSQYPRYALGLGYILSLDLPKKLVGASRHVKAVYIEDVYLGLCMEYLGISPTDPPSWGYFNVFPVQYSRCAFSRLVATTTDEHLDRVKIWQDFKKTGPYC
ncbi:beta-1,3-galactosyltransferase 2-like [Lates calcarifer]|uniref:Hexosyltransferase n=1 Tax=Lates calcarifer TaxID=8187 RepID=A0A4W6C627_LATCA|nr:beta-1,3-galactosyltransferase 2-like [Lates calcarifer]XP_050931656.1 beta-1,3-galactosyltransferase 2-like [Lates calcarifer]